MEHVNAATSLHQQQQQQQQQHLLHHQNLQQQNQNQQQSQPPPANDNQQQFCLRWHNHQTSLLSTLPILLDQSHLTDVTLSAEGRILRAHRVVLSACSTFFLELFRALDTASHPVIIIPGASFAAIVALLTFMYSGEVNVYEEQIPTLLNLAETLGIKGLADVQNNLQKSAKRHSDYADQLRKTEVDTPPTPSSPSDFAQQPSSTPLPPHVSSLLPPPLAAMPSSLATPTPPPALGKLPLSMSMPLSMPLSSQTPLPSLPTPTPLESLFLKSLQFYPNLLPQPLNFSQSALNKTSELLAKYQQHCSLYQSALGGVSAKDLLGPLYMEEGAGPASTGEDGYNAKRLCTGDKKPTQQQQQQQQHQQLQHQTSQQQKDIKRIDKIVESLRCGNNNKAQGGDNILASATVQQQQQQQHYQKQQQQQQMALKTSVASFAQSLSPHLTTKPPMFASATSQSQSQQQQQQQPLPSSSAQHGFMSSEDQAKLQQQLEHFASCSREAAAAAAASNRATPDCVGLKTESGLLSMGEKLPTSSATPTPTPASPQGKTPSNSKLYATCFICHKQLSNQYNLRVHLETHQNVRYACNVCSHVSRSKDALRKHVSYRHPGAPSPCESEARRKRAKTLNLPSSAAAATSVTGTPPSPTSAPTTPFQLSGGGEVGDVAGLAPGYMFMPNQFHMAAAAAANNAQQQQQQQQQLQQNQQQQQLQHQQNQPQMPPQNSKSSSNATSLPTTPTTTTTTGANVSNNVATASPSSSTLTTTGLGSTSTAGDSNDLLNPVIKSEHESPSHSPLVGGAVTTP